MSERIDEIGFKNYKLIQDTDGFCYGIDAVLLAHFSGCNKEDAVFDLCCGNGAVSLIIDAKYNPQLIKGLDLQQSQVDLAIKNAELNNLQHKLSFICGDAKNIESYFAPGSFDVVVCNPPYFESGAGVVCDDDKKLIARHESTAGIKEFIYAAKYLLKDGGKMNIIHRPARLADIMYHSRCLNMEPKKIQFISPYPKETPNMVLLQLVKGGGKEIKVLPEIIVRNADGQWSDQINEIYDRSRE